MRYSVWSMFTCVAAFSLAGCATNHASPSRFVGKPVSYASSVFPEYLKESGTDKKGQPTYFWTFTDFSTEQVKVGYYSYFDPSKRGYVMVDQYADKQFRNECKVTITYDPATMLTTKFKIDRTKKAKCRVMNMHLDGSAHRPPGEPPKGASRKK